MIFNKTFVLVLIFLLLVIVIFALVPIYDEYQKLQTKQKLKYVFKMGCHYGCMKQIDNEKICKWDCEEIKGVSFDTWE